MNNRPTTSSNAPAFASGIGLTILMGCLAAWLAAGSTGLLGHSLRHALTWLALGAALLPAWPRTRRDPRSRALLLLSAIGALALSIPLNTIPNTLAVPLLLYGLAAVSAGEEDRRALRTLALATALFALYLTLRQTVPAVWFVVDRAAHTLGAIIGACARHPLNVGPTFGGLDFLVLSTAWFLAARLRWPLALMLLMHALYLAVLAYAADAMRLLPPHAATDAPESLLRSMLRHGIPWNLPLLALALHLAVIAATLRNLVTRTAAASDHPAATPRRRRAASRAILTAALLAIAVTLGLNATIITGRPSLEGRKVVFYEEGFLNWLKPEYNGEYGRLSIGMYGLLPRFVESLGATCLVSKDLSADDLAGADVLVLIFPDRPWRDGQLARIENFVRRGGSLWVLGEHSVEEKEGGARFNDILTPLGMQVQFDCAEFAIGGWLDSYETPAHPATLGVPDTRNQFGVVIGASLILRPPAYPLLIGRWGWSDTGDTNGNAMMGNQRYDAGERLGDLVLAGERRLGKGRVVAFGDTSLLSNGINIGSHPFNARLLAYLASHSGGPLSAPRATLSLLLALALAAWLAWRPPAPAIAGLAIAAFAVTHITGTRWTDRAMQFFPHAGHTREHRLAYVDYAHLGRFSGESWRNDGLMGVELAFMRDGYLTLALTDFTEARLSQADLLLSVAPNRPFSAAERRAIRNFLERGGIFILTVGRPERAASLPLLREYGFEIGDGTEAAGSGAGPAPFGFFKAPFFNSGAYMNYVRFHAAWPLVCSAPDARVFAYGKGDLPSILMRRVGRGKFLVVGDSSFALNKNLEFESGMPFEGMRENPDFWRWLLAELRDEPRWTLPNPEEQRAAWEASRALSEGAQGRDGSPSRPQEGSSAPAGGAP